MNIYIDFDIFHNLFLTVNVFVSPLSLSLSLSLARARLAFLKPPFRLLGTVDTCLKICTKSRIT